MTCALCPTSVHIQLATADPVGAIVEGGLDPAEDPGWAEPGAHSPTEYARWAGHLCGMACLHMALGADAPSLFALRDGAVKYGAYTEDADGTIRGLLHAPFARYVSEVYGREATVHRHVDVAGIPGLPASVHYGVRCPERPAPGRASGAGDRADRPTGPASTSTTRRGRMPGRGPRCCR